MLLNNGAFGKSLKLLCGKVRIQRSFFCLDLLDDLYPKKQLNPKDPKEKARQKLFIDRFGNTVSKMCRQYFVLFKV